MWLWFNMSLGSGKSEHRLTDRDGFSPRIVKAVFSLASIVLFFIALFGESHDVDGYLRSMFFASFPVAVDITTTYEKIRSQSAIIAKRKKLYFAALLSAFTCSFLSFTLLLSATIDSVQFFKSFVYEGHLWGLALILFPFLIYPFIINVIQPSVVIELDIRQEERNLYNGIIY